MTDNQAGDHRPPPPGRMTISQRMQMPTKNLVAHDWRRGWKQGSEAGQRHSKAAETAFHGGAERGIDRFVDFWYRLLRRERPRSRWG